MFSTSITSKAWELAPLDSGCTLVHMRWSFKFPDTFSRNTSKAGPHRLEHAYSAAPVYTRRRVEVGHVPPYIHTLTLQGLGYSAHCLSPSGHALCYYNIKEGKSVSCMISSTPGIWTPNTSFAPSTPYSTLISSLIQNMTVEEDVSSGYNANSRIQRDVIQEVFGLLPADPTSE